MKNYIKVTNPIVSIMMVGRFDDEITFANQRAARSSGGLTAKTALRRIHGALIIWKFVKGSVYVHKEYVRSYELN